MCVPLELNICPQLCLTEVDASLHPVPLTHLKWPVEGKLGTKAVGGHLVQDSRKDWSEREGLFALAQCYSPWAHLRTQQSYKKGLILLIWQINKGQRRRSQSLLVTDTGFKPWSIWSKRSSPNVTGGLLGALVTWRVIVTWQEFTLNSWFRIRIWVWGGRLEGNEI